jgi:hypothetical protein
MRARVAALGLLWLAVTAAAGCDDLRKSLFSPRIEINCKVLQKSCRMVNYGDPGEACFKVSIFHRTTGRTLSSEPVCSGHLERNTPVWREVRFPEADPLTECMGVDLRKDFKTECEVQIDEVQ